MCVQVSAGMPSLASRSLLNDGPGSCEPGSIFVTGPGRCMRIRPTAKQAQAIDACTADQKYAVVKGSATNSPVACQSFGGAGGNGELQKLCEGCVCKQCRCHTSKGSAERHCSVLACYTRKCRGGAVERVTGSILRSVTCEALRCKINCCRWQSHYSFCCKRCDRGWREKQCWVPTWETKPVPVVMEQTQLSTLGTVKTRYFHLHKGWPAECEIVTSIPFEGGSTLLTCINSCVCFARVRDRCVRLRDMLSCVSGSCLCRHRVPDLAVQGTSGSPEPAGACVFSLLAGRHNRSMPALLNSSMRSSTGMETTFQLCAKLLAGMVETVSTNGDSYCVFTEPVCRAWGCVCACLSACACMVA